MKILIVTQFFYPENFSINEIAKSLVSFGHEVSVLTGKPNYGYGKIIPEYKKMKYQKYSGMDIYRVNLFARKKSRTSIILNYLSFWKNANSFAAHLDEHFDVVLSVSLSPVISISPAIKYAKEKQVPHLLYCLDLWPESPVITGAVKKDSFAYKILYKWSHYLYQKCDKIAISSPSFKEYFYDVLRIKDKGFKTIYQPAILPKERFEPIVYQKKHNIVYAGNIGKLQLMNIIVQSAELLKGRKDIVIHLIGMGSLSEFVKESISKLNLQENLVYHGPLPVEEATRYYYNADALLVALNNQGQVGKTIPNKLIQYLSFGVPIIGMINGDGKKLLQDSKGSFVVEEDPKELFEAIIKASVLSKEERKTLGDLNKKFYIDNLSTELLSHSLEKELLDLIKV